MGLLDVIVWTNIIFVYNEVLHVITQSSLYHSETNSGKIKLIFKEFGVVYVLMAGLISKTE